MPLGVHRHGMDDLVDEVVVDVVRVLINEHEVPLTVAHDPGELLALIYQDLVLCVQVYVHSMHQSIIRLADNLIAILQQKHAFHKILELFLCLVAIVDGINCWNNHCRINKHELV